MSSTLQMFRDGLPGVYLNVPERDYRASPIVSQSTLKAGRDSMAHLRHAIQTEREPTDSMRLGTALHVAVLEPSEMVRKVAAWDGEARRGSAWNAFQMSNRNKTIITHGQHAVLRGMVNAIRNHPAARELFSAPYEVEASAIGTLHGLTMKARADALFADKIVDLKTCASTADRDIRNAIHDYGYAVQAYVYSELFRRRRFVFVFVESSPPHDVRCVELSEVWADIGRAETEGLIAKYRDAAASGVWPGRSDVIETIDPPTWVEDMFPAGATLGGETL